MSPAQDIPFSLAEHAEIGLSFHRAPSIVFGSETDHKLLLQRTQWLLHSTTRVSIKKILHFLKLSTPRITLKSCLLSHSVCRCFIMLQTTVLIGKNDQLVVFFRMDERGSCCEFCNEFLHIIRINFMFRLCLQAP
jgi:hypothetical protein